MERWKGMWERAIGAKALRPLREEQRKLAGWLDLGLGGGEAERRCRGGSCRPRGPSRTGALLWPRGGSEQRAGSSDYWMRRAASRLAARLGPGWLRQEW